MMIRKRKAGSPVKRLLKGALVDIRASDAVVNSSGNVTHLLNSANRNQSAYFDGVDDYISTPDSGALGLTGAVQTITLYGVAAVDWTTATEQAMVGQWNTTTDRNWYVTVDGSPDGGLAVGVSNNGTSGLASVEATALPSFSNGLENRYDIQVEYTASTNMFVFRTCVAGGTLAQLGDPVERAWYP